MNILIVSQYFWPENFRVNDLCQEWVSRGHMVTVLTGKPNYPSGQVFPEYRECSDAFNNFSGARVCRVPMLARGQGSFRLFFNYLSFVLGACLFGPLFLRGRKFDVVFVFEPSPVTVGLPAILLGRMKSAPVVFWALDLWPETLAAIGVVRSPRVLGLVGHLVRFIYKHCTLVLGQSKGFLVNIAKYCSSPEKIRFFPSWAEDVFEQKNVIPATEIDRLPGGFNVLFAGNLGESQDLPAVLVAAEALRAETHVRWFIVGDGRKFDWLSAEVTRKGLQDQVFLLGRYPVERMPSFYACADALLVSLKRDPMFSMTIPGKVQSYLMAGVPLLGMLDGEGAKVISDAKAGLVCPAGNGLGLAAAVRQMLALSPEARYQLGVNGRAFAELEFGRGLLMDRLVGLLHEAVDLYRNKRVVP